jgi:hypothetical protein
MKKLIIATALLITVAAAARARTPQDKSLDTAAAAQASPGAGAGRSNPARPAIPPEPADPDDRRPEVRLNPVRALTPDDVNAAPEGEAARAPTRGTPAADEPPKKPDEAVARAHFRWRPAFEQSLLFLAVQHGYALTQPKTRRDLHGPFFKDYVRSVRSLHGWDDGGRFFTNYVAHPLEGSLLGFVQIQNDPAGARLRFGGPGGYWRSRMKALAWSAAWSTQFEIGPVSQASIGNVGLHGKQTYVDLVMTPTAGLGLLVAEDVLDRYVIERLERRSHNRYVRMFARTALNPTRTAANLLRFKKPWHRDAGLR